MWSKEYRDHVFALTPAQVAALGYSRLTNPLCPRSPDDPDPPVFADELPNEALVKRFEARRLSLYHMKRLVEGDWWVLSGGIPLVFDPNAPIKPQLEGLEQYLLAMRHHDGGSDRERDHKSKWVTYLRFIDADDKEASYAEMAEVLLDIASKGNKHKARDILKAARALQARM